MDLATYLTVLRRNWLVLLLAVVLGTAAGTVLYVSTPKSYATTVDFYVSTPTSQNTNPQASGEFAESRVNSYVLLLSSEQLAQRVVATGGIDLTPLQVSREITASAKINTVVINAVVTDRSQARSLRIAQGVAATLGSLVDDLDNAGRSTPVVVIHTVSGPTPENGPVAPSRTLYVGAGLLAGLVVGLGVALLRGARQRNQPDANAGSPVSGAAAGSALPVGEAVDRTAAGSAASGSSDVETRTVSSDEEAGADDSWHWGSTGEGDDASASVPATSER